MRPDIKTFRVNNHYLIAANVGLRVVVLQPDIRTVAYDIDLNADCEDCFFLSRDGGLLAVGLAYERSCCIEVIDLRDNTTISNELREKSTILRIDAHALDVMIAPNGETLLYTRASKPGGYAVHLPSGQRQKLPDVAAFVKGAWLTDHAILPDWHGRIGLRISYWPLVITPVKLPTRAEVWFWIAHPTAKSFAMLDATGTVSNLKADSLEPLWQRVIPEADWISYSGDGRFIAVKQREPAGGPVKRVVILDSDSGEILRAIDTPEQAQFPLDGPRVLCYSGRFLNAETGAFEEGVSAPGFWKSFDR